MYIIIIIIYIYDNDNSIFYLKVANSPSKPRFTLINDFNNNNNKVQS